MKITCTPYIPLAMASQETNISQGFKLTKIDDLPCAYCGKSMKTRKTMEKIFDSDSEKTPEMLEHAIELGIMLSPFRQQVLNFLIQTKSLNNLTTDNQILRTARIISHQYIKEDILKRYNEIIDIIKKSNARRLNTFLLFNEDLYREILHKKGSYAFLIRFVRNENYLHISPYTKNKDLSKINNVISDIETDNEQYSEDYIVRKVSYKTAKEFYMDLFDKIISSADHIIARSKGGNSTRGNFLAVCKGCNEQKGTMPLPLFIHLRPQVKQNIESQISFLKAKIPGFISCHKLGQEYINYPDEVSRNLMEITNDRLDLRG